MRALRRAGTWAFLAFLLVFALAPICWMLVGSLKEGDEQLIFGNPWWVGRPILANYLDLFGNSVFGLWILNTLLVLAATLAIAIVASMLAAYALALLRVPFRRGLVFALFGTYLLPQSILFLPMVRMLSDLHLLNSPAALIATYPGLVIPFASWVLWGFFRQVPPELVDLAVVEGAGPLRVLRTVLLPLALPSLAAIALFGAAIVLNDYLYAFTFISTRERMTLMGGLGTTNVDVGDSGSMFAAMLLGTTPLAFGCAWFADRYAGRLTTGMLEP